MPRSIYQYTNMATMATMLEPTSMFGVVFFVSKSLSGIERRNKLEKSYNLIPKASEHVRILIYRTWPI